LYDKIYSFWDILHIAIWYRQKSDWHQRSDFVHFSHLAIFFIMHISSSSQRSTSPTRHFTFETIWPTLESPGGVVGGSQTYSSSSSSSTSPSSNPTSPPTSPILSHRKHVNHVGVNNNNNNTNALLSSNAPLSPRNSPRSSPLSGNTSPRKNLNHSSSSSKLNHTSFIRSYSQQLNILREKIPLLLYVLSFQDCGFAENKEESSMSEMVNLSTSSSLSHKRPAPHVEDRSHSDMSFIFLFLNI
jgi:hypothetical protein